MKRFLLLILVGCMVACTDIKPTDELPQFERVSETETGIDFKNTLTENDSLNYFTYGYMYMGGGVAAGDINNDGLIDLYFTGNMVPNKLFLNKGDLKFEDITENSGTAGDSRWYTGVTMADVNHDGFLDIYCSVGGKFTPKENQLLLINETALLRKRPVNLVLRMLEIVCRALFLIMTVMVTWTSMWPIIPRHHSIGPITITFPCNVL